jgi:hypothetical protein
VKIPREAFVLAWALFAGSASFALPPTSIGDSFLSFTYGGPGGSYGHGLFYFGSDGTCRQLTLSTSVIGEGGVPITTYDISREGTYTYTPDTADPTQYSLIASIDGPGVETGKIFSLQFAHDTSGTLGFAYRAQFGLIAPTGGSFTLLLHSKNGFLANVSNRVTLHPADTAISGLVIQGSGSRLVLVRTIGPTLAQFGVSPASQHPQLNLFLGTGSDNIGSGEDWGAVTGYDTSAISWIFTEAGAFALQAGSTDVVFFSVLRPGVYTAQASDATTPATGASALTEAYILPYSG